MISRLKHIGFVVALIASAVWMSSCKNDDIPSESYYTFTGETLAQYLENRPEQYGDYVKILDRVRVADTENSSTMLSLLGSAGYYTCFAPDNETIGKYLKAHDLQEVEQLTDSAARVIAFMSIISSTQSVIYESKNFYDKIPDQNFLKRTIYLTPNEDNTSYKVNSMANIVERDLDVHNGVIHRIDSVLEPSDLTLLGFFSQHPEYSLFYEAVELTAMHQRVNSELEDISYVPPIEAIGIYGSKEEVMIPQNRFFYYTCFVEPNEVFEKEGIITIDDLKAYAKQWFEDTFGGGDAEEIYEAGMNENWTDENNYLNRFVAYHFLEKKIDTPDFTRYKTAMVPGYLKFLEFAETLAPQQTLCMAAGKNSFASDEYEDRLQLNPSADQVALPNVKPNVGWTRPARNGVLLSTKKMMESANGVFHELESILTYPRADFKKTRMRMDIASLFPEIMNNDMRAKYTNAQQIFLPKDYLTNCWYRTQDTKFVYMNPNATAGNYTHNDWQGDEFLAFSGFDIDFKLPPVPAGTYEVRFGYTQNSARGCAQLYVGDSRETLQAFRIPVDLTVQGVNYGWVKDTGGDEDYDSDKLLHANGFMKGPNSAYCSNGNQKTTLREKDGASGESVLRCVMGNITLDKDGPIYIRFRDVSGVNLAQFMMDYIEVCPASIYDNPYMSEPRD